MPWPTAGWPRCCSGSASPFSSSARPLPPAPARPLTVSVVIPARNEAGNIAAAVARTPDMGGGTELIFVEGHSRDDTWAAIQSVQREHPHRAIKIMQQTGKGKGDAVRLGFAAASGDILMILDADLTMPPEDLPKFYERACQRPRRVRQRRAPRLPDGREGHAVPESLREQGLRPDLHLAPRPAGEGHPLRHEGSPPRPLRAHRRQSGLLRRLRPFGDFDLLFGAAKLHLQIVDVPIRYKERTYGETNIQRWKHGWLLLRMVLFAARKLKFI
jgi:glycosyltransferase involved in cell wall biosynthesis